MSGEVEQPVETPEPASTEVAEQPVEQPIAERDVEQDTLDIPNKDVEGGKERYVPLAALEGARKELKGLKAELEDARTGSAKAQQLEQRIDELSQHLASIAPKAQAYDAALAAQQQYRQPEPEEDEDAVLLAQTMDLWTADGKPDVAKAKKALALMDKRGRRQAEDTVAPFAQNQVGHQSDRLYARALKTIEDLGIDIDRRNFDSVWLSLSPAQRSSPDSGKWLLAASVGADVLMKAKARQGQAGQPAARERTATGQFKAADIPAPLHTEKAGGKDLPDGGLALNDKERAYIKRAGISEKEYFETARNMPGLRK